MRVGRLTPTFLLTHYPFRLMVQYRLVPLPALCTYFAVSSITSFMAICFSTSAGSAFSFAISTSGD